MNPIRPKANRFSLHHDGHERTYLLHVPESVHASEPPPVVLAFHGGGSNAEGMERFSGLSEKADDAGFVVAYPDGTGAETHALHWNAGIDYRDAPPTRADDVGFIAALLDDLASRLEIDATRVFAAGMSNGGMFSYRLATELSNRIAAIAAVGGTMVVDGDVALPAMPVLHFHGTEDHFVPFDGGIGKRSLARVDYPSVRSTLARWVDVNNCDPNPELTEWPTVVEDGTAVCREVYSGPTAKAEVVLFVINGGGHTWPGRKPLWLFLGKSTRNLQANDVIWNFFRRQRIGEPSAPPHID